MQNYENLRALVADLKARNIIHPEDQVTSVGQVAGVLRHFATQPEVLVAYDSVSALNTELSEEFLKASLEASEEPDFQREADIVLEKAEEIIPRVAHRWKPILGATVDDDATDGDGSDPDATDGADR